MKNTIVSVITPSFNCGEYIGSTIASVINQSYQNWEMIIVDDMSTDNSLKIIEEFAAKDSRIKVISLRSNSGAAVARNVAIQASTGRFVAFLDSDDLWLPYKLEKQLRFMLENDFSFTYSFFSKINESGQSILNCPQVPLKLCYKELLTTNYIGCLTVIYDTHYFGKIKMPLIKKRQDYALWLKLLKKVEYSYCLDEYLAFYRVRVNSISSNKLNTISSIWRVYREIEKLPVLQSLYYLAHYALKGVYRKYFCNYGRSL